MAKRLAWAALVAALLSAPASSWAGYGLELNKVTETGRIYNVSRWDAELIWHATFFNDHFREVFKAHHKKIKHLDELNAERFESEQGQRHMEGWDFFVAIYTKEEYKRFSTYEDTFWEIELVTGSGEVADPISVEQLPITPYEHRMFPYLDRWSKGYRVTFPKVDLGREFQLKLKSVVGTSTLEFDAE